jgi:hypothetical protein
MYKKFLYINFIILFNFCLTSKEKVITGVEVYNQPNRIIFISTGKASENAIKKDIRVIKETASKEAARLLLENELNKNQYRTIRDKVKITYIEFINDGEYCKITAEYTP